MGHTNPVPSDLDAYESLRTESGRSAVGVVRATVVLAGLLFARAAATASDAGPGGDAASSGQVIERETGKPVGGAEILLERSIRGSTAPTPPPWAGTSIIRTDAQGRFRVEFPAEQVAHPRLFIALRIRHPEFISRKSSQVALEELIREQARGEAPFFTTIALERGLEYTGGVVVPGGKAVAGIPYAFEHRTSRSSRSIPIIMDDYDGQTDDDGRIRMRMPKTHALGLYVGPPRNVRARFPFAPYQHFWGTDSALGQPDVWAPTDLGQIVLARDPTRGPACRLGRPADCRPDDHRLSAQGARSAFDHDRGRRHLRPGAAPPRELSDLWGRTDPVLQLGS